MNIIKKISLVSFGLTFWLAATLIAMSSVTTKATFDWCHTKTSNSIGKQIICLPSKL